MRIEHNTVIS